MQRRHWIKLYLKNDIKAIGSMIFILMLSLLIIISVTLYSFTKKERAEYEIDLSEKQTLNLRKHSIEFQEAILSIVDTSIYGAAAEIANHGGFREELVPPKNINGIPYWFFGGGLSQIPTEEMISNMFYQEVEKRFLENFDRFRKMEYILPYKLSITEKKLDISLQNITIHVTGEIKLAYTIYNIPRTQRVVINKKYPIRLLHIRHIMKQLVIFLSENETLERHFLYFTYQDPRIPIPKAGIEMSCKDQFVPVKSLETPIKDNLRLALSQTSKYIQRYTDFYRINSTLVLFKAIHKYIKYSARDRYNNEKYILKKANRVYPCQRTWDVSYNYSLPVMITVMDVAPFSSLNFATSDQLQTNLRFNIIYNIDIKDNNIYRQESNDEAVFCKGACSIILTVKDSLGNLPEIEKLFIDYCDFSDNAAGILDNKYIDEVPCGEIIFKLVPVDKDRYLTTERSFLLRAGEDKEIFLNISQSASLELSVFAESRILCNQYSYSNCRGRVIRQYIRKLGYIDGNPPRYIIAVLNSLESPDMRFKGVTDTEGKIFFNNIPSGVYLLSLYPSIDKYATPSYKVIPKSRIISLEPGENRAEFYLLPQNPVYYEGKYYLVDDVRMCNSCS